MPLDLRPFLDPSTTAVVALEVQENLLLPERAMIPGLAAHATSIGLVDRLAALYASARRVGATVVYVTDQRRPDGFGGPRHAMVGRSITGERHSPGHGPIVAALVPQPGDISIEREQGMTGFFSTPLDAYLRNLEVRTVVITGVSANIAVLGTAIEAMNLGYRVVVPGDGIAGDPPEYVDALLRFTLRNVGVVTSAHQIMELWDSVDRG